MPRFSKLITGELRKITLRPILYVITAILVLALILSVSLFSPTKRVDTSYTNHFNDCKNVGEVYSLFNSSAGNINKSRFDQDMNNIDATLTYYEGIVADTDTSFTSELKALMRIASNATNLLGGAGKFEKYLELVVNVTPGTWTAAYITATKNARTDLLDALNALKTRYNGIMTIDYTSILVKSQAHVQINELLANFIAVVDRPEVNYDDLVIHETTIREIQAGAYITKLNTRLSELEDVVISTKTLTTLRNDYYTIALSRLATSLASIEELNTLYPGNSDKTTLNKIKKEANYYYSTVDSLSAVINSSVQLSIIQDRTDADIHQYKGFQGIYTYAINEDYARNTYLFDNDKFAYQFANVFSVGATSGAEASAFDFMFFGLELFGFIVVITCVVLGASMVAGEQSSGTLKLLAIRPFKRSKILSGKLLSTIIFGFTLVIFSAIVLLLIGFTLYGIDATTILAVFNGGAAFAISPWLLMLIYVLMLLFKVFVYTLLAICISTLLKSNVAAVGISILVYFLSSIFSVVFSSSYWYAFVPFTNIDLFKFFGGAFVDNMGSNPLSFVFSSPMLYNMNFWISIGLVGVLVTVLFFVTYIVFNKREIR